eukprot:8394685-Pyramimonas_sp.AAC.1
MAEARVRDPGMQLTDAQGREKSAERTQGRRSLQWVRCELYRRPASSASHAAPANAPEIPGVQLTAAQG